jgi:hypothetical protein
MTRRILAKLGLAVLVLSAAALPARADYIVATSLSGVNLSYTATETAGNIDITFDSTSLVTKVNAIPGVPGSGLVIPAVTAVFPDLGVTPGTLTPDANGGYTFDNQNVVTFSYYITDNFGNVVQFDYLLIPGTLEGNTLQLTGAIFVDPGSPNTTFSNGTATPINTYDVSGFELPAVATFGITFTDDSGQMANALLTGNGAFGGTANFSQFIVPEPSSVTLLGIGGLLTVALRRRRKA